MKNITVDKKTIDRLALDKKLPLHEFIWRLALLYGSPAPGMASLPLSCLNPEPEISEPESKSAPAVGLAMAMSPYFKEKV